MALLIAAPALPLAAVQPLRILSFEQRTGDACRIEYGAYLGATHDLERTGVVGTNWYALPPNTNLFGLSDSMSVLFPAAQTNSFYRVRGRTGRLPMVGDKWALWSEGTALRGANIAQRRVYPELDGPTFLGPGPVGPPYSFADFTNLAALGANYVNISGPGIFTENPPYGVDTNIQAHLDKLLAWIGGAGMTAVLSFRTGPGRSEFSLLRDGAGVWFPPEMINDAVWSNQPAQDAWVEMWRYTADRYRDQPAVVGYDLMAEPNAHVIAPGGPWYWPPDFYSLYGGSLYDWNQLHPRIAAAIREIDPDTPLLVACDGYGNLNWLPYVATNGDSRTVYTFHQYAPHQYTHQYPGGETTNTYPGFFDADWDNVPETVDRQWLSNHFVTVDNFMAEHGAPVGVNEYGLMRWEPGAEDFLSDEIDIMEERGINHACWLWECSHTQYTHEVHAFNFRLGPDPENRQDIPTNSLLRALSDVWQRNTNQAWFRPAAKAGPSAN